jgi:pimeloyl-ACP methyl ester carboxylesterase
MIVRVIWISFGIIFMVWLADSFRAKGVGEEILRTNAAVSVTETDEYLSFNPPESRKDIGLIFFPGGGVDPRAYAPLIRTVSENGYISVIVKLPYRFAPFESHRVAAIQNARKVMNASALRKWVIAGHSKGGAIAAEFVHTNAESVSALILIGTTHPTRLDLSHLSISVKKVLGTNDGVAPEEGSEKYRGLLPAGTEWVRIPGGNHSQFGYYGSQLGDNQAAISREEQQRRTLEAIITTLEKDSSVP